MLMPRDLKNTEDPLFENLAVIDRIRIMRMQHQQLTGHFPTRLVLTPDDWGELEFYLKSNDDPGWLPAPRTVSESELYGMRLAIDQYAKKLRVYFQES